MYGVADHNAVPRGLLRGDGRLYRTSSAIDRRQKIFVIIHVMLFMKSSRETEIRKLQMAVTIDENVVGLDVAIQDLSGRV